MGTDIHTALQKRDNDGKWKTIAKELYEGRNYDMFDALAGVRGLNDKPLVEPQGFYPPDSGVFLGPQDEATLRMFPQAKDYYVEDYWLGSHDFGWIMMDTYFNKKVDLEAGMVLAPLTEKLLNLMEEFTDPDETYDRSSFRMLFGFDS